MLCLLYWGFSGDSSWCSIGKKSWCIYLYFVNKHMLPNNCSGKIWDDWHYNSFNNVDIAMIAVLVIHANNKYSVSFFYISYNVKKPVLWKIYWVNMRWLRFVFLRVAIIIHALNLVLECIERKHAFKK